MRILICSDGSEWAQKSARFALQLFRETAHALTILVFKQHTDALEGEKKSIMQGTQDKEDNIGSERSSSVIEDELHDLVGDFDIAVDEVAWEREEGNMASHLLDIAPDYELICLGGAGKGGFSRSMLGLIVDEVVLEGKGNLMVTKKSDASCRNVLVVLPSEDVYDTDTIHYIGRLFKGSDVVVTVNVLWSDLPHRFEGYLEAATGQRMKRMVDEDLLPDKRDRLEKIKKILKSYEVESKVAYQDSGSVSELVDDAKSSSYDLIVVHPPAPGTGLLQQLEPNKQSLNLMRKSEANVMLLRAVPPHAD
ncbi:MAG: universal stress protein [Longimonas sp.]|uniref:universal stress protein n=1 Tax=Longimonas sp. TaxID=2039626 RepID=UPI0033483AD3